MQTRRSNSLILIALLVAIGGFTARAGADPLDPGRHRAPGTYVWIGSHRLHIHCMGRGTPTVIFDSGLGGTALDWSLVQPQVARFTRACAYDRAGYGWSTRSPSARSSATIVAELHKLLGFGSVPGPYVLVGHSFGGFNMRLFAAAHPQRVAGLVLVDSSHEDQFRRFEDADLGLPAPRGGQQFVIDNHYEIPDGLPGELQGLARAFASSPDSIAALYGELRNFRISALQVSSADTPPDVPLVVITRGPQAGTSSPQARLRAGVWMEMQEDLARRSRRGQLVIARTGEHHIQLHEPAVVVEAIRSVVASSRGELGAGPAR